MDFGIMALWHFLISYEINFISLLRNISHPLNETLAMINFFLEPALVFFFYIPIVGMTRLDLMVNLMITTEFASFVASLLKMMTQADRPFWMVRESVYFYNKDFSKLHYDMLKCEASSGFPSIHTTVLTVILLQKQNFNLFRQYPKINKFIWKFTVCITIGMMCLSEQYYGSHFFYQCLFGVLLGFFVVKFYNMYKKKILSTNKIKAFAILSTLGLVVAITYIIERVLDFDPHYGTRMAFKWCENIDLLSSKATELYLIFGNLGTLSGIAFAFPLNSRALNNGRLYLKKSIPIVIASIIFKAITHQFEITDQGKIMYLVWRFAANCITTYSTIYFLSKFALKENNVIKAPVIQLQQQQSGGDQLNIQPRVSTRRRRTRSSSQLEQ